jgi:hypothetical protein
MTEKKTNEPKTNSDYSVNTPRNLADLESKIFGSNKPDMGRSNLTLSYGSARFRSKSHNTYNAKVKLTEEFIARLKNEQRGIRAQVVSADLVTVPVLNPVRYISFGRLKVDVHDHVIDTNLSHRQEVIFPPVRKPHIQGVLQESLLQRLNDVLSNAADRESCGRDIKIFFSALITIGHYRIEQHNNSSGVYAELLSKFEAYTELSSILDDLFQTIENGKGKVSHTSEVDSPKMLQEKRRDDRFTEVYIDEQASLFHKSFDKLYEEYPEKYVLFHNDEILFSSDSYDEVARVAYEIRKVKDIFIKKVSSMKENHEVLTRLG